jgi:hypothetical protein
LNLKRKKKMMVVHLLQIQQMIFPEISLLKNLLVVFNPLFRECKRERVSEPR